MNTEPVSRLSSTNSNEDSTGRSVIDALAEFCPVEWHAWTAAYFARPAPTTPFPSDLLALNPRGFEGWSEKYPSGPPSGVPSSWQWLEGQAAKLWHFYPTSRERHQAAVPAGPGLSPVWTTLREKLRRGDCRATAFRMDSIIRESIPSEAWERLGWDLNPLESRVSAGSVSFEHVRIFEHSAALAAANEEPPRSGFPGRPRKTSKELLSTELKRRALEGHVESTLIGEARALIEWLSREYPEHAHASIGRIQNLIRAQYSEWKQECSRRRTARVPRPTKSPLRSPRN